jgi:hypothetical protein
MRLTFQRWKYSCAREREEVFPALGGAEPGPREEQRGRGLVLEAAAALVGAVDEEDVALHRQAVEERRLGLDDAGEIGDELLLVELRVSPHDDLVGHVRRR